MQESSRAFSQAHTKPTIQGEVIGQLKPILAEVQGQGSSLSQRMAKTRGELVLETLKIPNTLNGQEFMPLVPENTPIGTVMTISRVVTNTEDGKPQNVVTAYEIRQAPDGRKYAAPVEPNTDVKGIIGREVTGDDLGEHDPKPSLSQIRPGGQYTAKDKSETTFQKVLQTNAAVVMGQDYFTVAIATPLRLGRG